MVWAWRIADLRSDSASDGTLGADEGHLEAAAVVRRSIRLLSSRSGQPPGAAVDVSFSE